MKRPGISLILLSSTVTFCLCVFLLSGFSGFGKHSSLAGKRSLLAGGQANNGGSVKVTILLAGDVMLGRTVEIVSREKNDFSYPFRKVAGVLKSAGLVYLNLENPIISDCPPAETGFKFCANPEMLNGLIESGIDVVSLANNHAGNYGQSGFDETLGYLKLAGIDATYDKNLVVKRVGKTSFGFLGFDFLDYEPKESDLELVKNYAKQVDVLIVGIHWGIEYKSVPESFQRIWARRLIESGADVVAGHHPHWVQSIECFEYLSVSKNQPLKVVSFESQDNQCPADSKIVYYSLGNLVFDQMWSEGTKKGLVVKLNFEGDKLVSQELLPTYMFSLAQPEFVLP